jgi:hypothetical protein
MTSSLVKRMHSDLMMKDRESLSEFSIFRDVCNSDIIIIPGLNKQTHVPWARSNPDQRLSFCILRNRLSMGLKLVSNMVHKPLAPLSAWILILDFNIMIFNLNAMCVIVSILFSK